MSFEAMGWATNQRHYTGTAKFILIMLANYANTDTGEFFHRHQTIADDCGVGKSTVRKWMTQFQEDGLIHTSNQYRDDGSQSSNIYRFNLHLLEELSRKGKAIRVQNQLDFTTKNNKGGVLPDSTPLPSDSRGGATKEQGGCHQIAPINLSNNQSNKPKENTTTLIFDYWREVMDKPKAQLGSKRKTAIERMLKIGYDQDFIKRAIVGCSRTLHNMGFDRNTGEPTGSKYNDIELICRSESNLERFESAFENLTIDQQLQRFAGGNYAGSRQSPSAGSEPNFSEDDTSWIDGWPEANESGCNVHQSSVCGAPGDISGVASSTGIEGSSGRDQAPIHQRAS